MSDHNEDTKFKSIPLGDVRLQIFADEDGVSVQATSRSIQDPKILAMFDYLMDKLHPLLEEILQTCMIEDFKKELETDLGKEDVDSTQEKAPVITFPTPESVH